MKHLLTLALLVCLGTFASAQIPSYVPTNGLVGWWPFNGNANDESGNGNHGTVRNGLTFSADRYGKTNNSLNFDGIDDFVNVPFLSQLNNISEFTFSYWLKSDLTFPSQNGIYGAIIGHWKHDGQYNGPIGIVNSITPTQQALSLIGGQGNYFNDSCLSANQWIHFSVVVNFTLPNKVSVYKNGQLVSNNVQYNNFPQLTGNQSTRTYFGAAPGPNGPYSAWNFYNGLLDDIAIYNRALSPAEVQQLYLGNTSNTAAASTVPGKILYQGLAVGANGKPIKNGTVGLRLSVLDSLPNGSTLYTETQTASTDAAGIFSTYLGGGTATAGTFANIPWANGNDKFLKVEMDAQGGTNYQNMGSTQLVSVPYAMAAGSLREGALLYGNNGQTYSLTIGANGPTWNCFPPVTVANAGADQLNVCGSSVTLAGNTPSNGTATWSILSGAGGSLGTANAPATTFIGTRVNSYSLRYRITNSCGSSADTVAVSLAPTTTVAYAGPDQLSLTGTTATLAANAPAAGETGAWSMVAGSGGSLSASNNPSVTFTKGTDSAYTLVWTITGPCGGTNDTVNLLFPAPVGTACGQAVIYAGETYPTVQIGTQCWFAKNLNVGTMISSGNQTNNGTMEKYCYNNDPANCSTYGGLYQWAEAVQYQNGASNSSILPIPFTGNVKGICPIGWHLPIIGEWGQLESFLSNSNLDGGALKSNIGLWNFPNTGATNTSGFSALPGGFRDSIGNYYSIGRTNWFWTSYESSDQPYYFVNYRGLEYNYSIFYIGNRRKKEGLSVRCLKD